jgi:hypothetical protein
MGLSEVFLSFLVSSIIACVLAVGQQLYKSKCDKIEMCCIKIHRNVEVESDVEQPPVEMPVFTPPVRKQSLDQTIHGDKR